jgi:hypothetical protein
MKKQLGKGGPKLFAPWMTSEDKEPPDAKWLSARAGSA